MMKHISKFYLLLILTFAIAGCKKIAQTIQPTQIEQLPSSTIIVPTSTHVPTLTPSRTLTPLFTTEHSLLPTLTTTITLTPVNTLEPDKAKETIKTLLQEPVDCSAPCFWGIVPGQTTNEEARNIFSHLGIQMASKVNEGKGFSGMDYTLESGLSIGATLKIQNNIVESIQIQLTPEEQRVKDRMEWLAYSPDALIKRYGLPSRVDFAVDPGPRLFLVMQMFFDAEDLIVQYTGVDIISSQKGSTKLCPLSAQFDTAWLWMGKNPIDPPSRDVSLENVTSLSLDEFSKLMTGKPEDACFDLRLDQFP